MQQENNQAQTEQHPFFPSGEWEGFYTYYPGDDQHRMQFTLTFKDNAVNGSGGDDIGSFTWKGTYNKQRMECSMNKYYPSHSVYYQGQVDENGIWGFWRLYGHQGGFHIWPKGHAYNQTKQAHEAEPDTEAIKEPVLIPRLAVKSVDEN